MNEIKPAAFSLETFRIRRFSFNEIESDSNTLSLDFKPSGLFNPKTGEYFLTFEASVYLQNSHDKPFVNAEMVAIFKFSDVNSIGEIPTYFYKNAIAIVFPYMRSFLSSITLQANLKQIILPIMNLSSLEQPLKDNTSLL